MVNKYRDANTQIQTLSQSDQISHILAWYGINSKSNPRQPGRVRWIKCGGQFASRFWRILRLCWLWSILSPDFQHFSSICQSRISNQLVKDGRVLSSQPLHVLTAPAIICITSHLGRFILDYLAIFETRLEFSSRRKYVHLPRSHLVHI